MPPTPQPTGPPIVIGDSTPQPSIESVRKKPYVPVTVNTYECDAIISQRKYSSSLIKLDNSDDTTIGVIDDPFDELDNALSTVPSYCYCTTDIEASYPIYYSSKICESFSNQFNFKFESFLSFNILPSLSILDYLLSSNFDFLLWNMANYRLEESLLSDFSSSALPPSTLRERIAQLEIFEVSVVNIPEEWAAKILGDGWPNVWSFIMGTIRDPNDQLGYFYECCLVAGDENLHEARVFGADGVGSSGLAYCFRVRSRHATERVLSLVLRGCREVLPSSATSTTVELGSGAFTASAEQIVLAHIPGSVRPTTNLLDTAPTVSSVAALKEAVACTS